MPKLIVVRGTDSETVMEGPTGHSVMEVLRDNGFDELLALCGGALSCATCHVWIDEDYISQLPEMSSEEDDLLENSEFRKANSRLCCQIKFTDSLDVLRVALPPSE